MIRRFLGPQPAEKEEEKDKERALVKEPVGPSGAPAPPAGGTEGAAPATANGSGNATAPGATTTGRSPAGNPAGHASQLSAPTASRSQPATETARSSPAPQTPIKTKEADVSQRPESLQAVPRVGHTQLSDQTVTVIGNGARLEGNLISASSLRIEGTVNGTVTAEGDVIVAPEAEVAADIKATNCTLGGRYKGNANASGTIELTSTARVEGNLTCRSLIINQGALFSGQSIMDLGPKKAGASSSGMNAAGQVTAAPGSSSGSSRPDPASAAAGASPKSE